MEGYLENSNSFVTCPHCGNEIGIYIQLNQVEFLQVGGVLSREIHGVCANCGNEIHWSISDRLLKRLLERHD